MYNRKICEIYIILFKNSPHQFFHNTIDLHFCYNNRANMHGYCNFVFENIINSSFHLSPSLFFALLSLSHKHNLHCNPPPTSPHHHHNSQPITKFDLITKSDLPINHKTQIIKSNGSSNPSTQT